MKLGNTIVNTSLANIEHPRPILLASCATKEVTANFTLGLPQALADIGIQLSAVLPGLAWTPCIVTGMEPASQNAFGS